MTEKLSNLLFYSICIKLSCKKTETLFIFQTLELLNSISFYLVSFLENYVSFSFSVPKKKKKTHFQENQKKDQKDMCLILHLTRPTNWKDFNQV